MPLTDDERAFHKKANAEMNDFVRAERDLGPASLGKAGFQSWADYNDFYGLPAANRQDAAEYAGEHARSFKYPHNDPNRRAR